MSSMGTDVSYLLLILLECKQAATADDPDAYLVENERDNHEAYCNPSEKRVSRTDA